MGEAPVWDYEGRVIEKLVELDRKIDHLLDLLSDGFMYVTDEGEHDPTAWKAEVMDLLLARHRRAEGRADTA